MASRDSLAQALGAQYRLERELGRGGFATVFLAHDLRHDRPVALKVLHPEVAANLGADRFKQEIRLAARLQPPHIVYYKYQVARIDIMAGQYDPVLDLIEPLLSGPGGSDARLAPHRSDLRAAPRQPALRSPHPRHESDVVRSRGALRRSHDRA